MGQSLVQRSSAECGVSERDREASIMRRPWPTRGSCAMGKKISSKMFVNYVPIYTASYLRGRIFVFASVCLTESKVKQRQFAYAQIF
jgi:hypothetical protein